MKRENAVEILLRYMNDIFSYVSRRIFHEQDRQDVAQEIALRVYQSLCVKEIQDIEHYVWVVARHTLANYYRCKEKKRKQCSLEDMTFEIRDQTPGVLEQMIHAEEEKRLCKEIAYLSQIQRQVLIRYYYDGQKQTEIAEALHIPTGTVKWHLNAAKQELRKGMEKMRDNQNLKFNPIRFSRVGICGSTGDLGSAANMFRSSLSQNIVYTIYHKEKTVHEIAEELAVSPVYVESEMEFLEEMSLVVRKGKKYLANILISEPDSGLLAKQKELYRQAAGDMAVRLYDALQVSFDLEHSPEILGEKRNSVLMWSLVFYLLTWQEEDEPLEIPFEEVADYRVDGGRNLITAQVESDEMSAYMKETGMDVFTGPCWNTQVWEDGTSGTLWVVDGDWTEKRVTEHYGGPYIERDLHLLMEFARGDSLSPEEYAFLVRKNYVKKEGDSFAWRIPVLKEGALRSRLLALAKDIRNEVCRGLGAQIEAYKKEVFAAVPKQVRRQQEYFLQNMLKNDSWLILYAKRALVESGRLSAPGQGQRDILSELFICAKAK